MKRMTAAAVCLISCMIMSGCGGGAVLQDDTADIAGELGGGAEEKTDEEPSEEPAGEPVSFDLSTASGISTFLEGEWELIDRKDGKDFGTLSLEKDGSFTFKRHSDNAQGAGVMTFGRNLATADEEPDTFRLELSDAGGLIPEGVELYGDEGTGGMFHVCSSKEGDFLYLKEIGNGDSVFSMYVFNTDADSDEIGNWSYDWLFRRDAGSAADREPEEGTFYAWAWKSASDGVWLQPMEEHEFETNDDYSNRKFMGGRFSETDDIRPVYYKINDRAVLDGISDRAAWDSGYPLMMCELTADKEGTVSHISEVDIALYNVYDMGGLDPEYSYEGMTFTVNGADYDMRSYAEAANAITGCERVGDWLIVDCHINPNAGVYEFFNIYSGDFEYEIAGALLTWKGDDLSTAVYAYYNEIFDFWGHRIGSIENGELYDLSIDGNTVNAECWIVDEIGREKEFTEKFEYEPCDLAVLSYYEYMLGDRQKLRELMEGSPAGSVALIMVNPPERMTERMPKALYQSEGELDRVVAAGLADGAEVFIEDMEPDASGKAERSEPCNLSKGSSWVFDVTVPEGMPRQQIVVRIPGKKDVFWPVWILSGKNPQISTFIK
ncbi:MAG: hypothetical protein K6G58_00855 [Lachnospiraceae bacterium]|nr:hypothetical protein [Lachnospiraceae bacterium]